jgi:hypothetical protein
MYIPLLGNMSINVVCLSMVIWQNFIDFVIAMGKNFKSLVLKIKEKRLKMKQEINLEKLLNEISNINLDEDRNRIYYLWEVKKLAKVLCDKILDLAAENAEIAYLGGNSDINDFTINKNSILQIKDWIK